MLITTLTTFLLPTLALAAPTTLDTRADSCAPASYTLSDFFLQTSTTSAIVNFNIKSTFSDTTSIEDSVTNGSTCSAEGASIPNSNVCSAPDRKLLFDLRAPQGQARYQITHTWVCNGQTWMSGNDVQVTGLVCDDAGGQRTCTAGTQTFAPQNVRMICNAPTC